RSARSGAWRFLSRERRARAGRGHFASLNRDQTVVHFVWIFEQTALRRARGARAVAVVCSAMTRAHEEPGLRKPTNATAKVRAVDGEDLESLAFDAPHPACRVHGLPVSRHNERIPERSQSGFAFRELTDWPERYPVEVAVRASARDRGQQKSADRHGE